VFFDGVIDHFLNNPAFKRERERDRERRQFIICKESFIDIKIILFFLTMNVF